MVGNALSNSHRFPDVHTTVVAVHVCVVHEGGCGRPMRVCMV